MNISYNRNTYDSRKIWSLHFSHLAKITNSFSHWDVHTLLSAAEARFDFQIVFPSLLSPCLIPLFKASKRFFLKKKKKRDFSKYRFNLVTTLLKPVMPSVSLAWHLRALMSWLWPTFSVSSWPFSLYALT